LQESNKPLAFVQTSPYSFCMDANTRLSEAIERSGLKRKEIAEQAGVSEATISRLLSGDIRSPGVDVAIRLSDVLNADVRALFGEAAA